MVLLENRSAKQYVLFDDSMSQICTFFNAALVRDYAKGVYQLQTDITLYVLCELPVASTTIIRTDTYLSNCVVFYEELVEPEDPDDPSDDDDPTDPNGGGVPDVPSIVAPSDAEEWAEQGTHPSVTDAVWV